MKDKKTLYTIIALLVIFLPLSIYGTIMHIKNGNVLIDDNPNKEYILNNKVYFYANDILVKTYSCEKTCAQSKPIIDDDIYYINYYADGNIPAPTSLTNSYYLFKDGDKNILYNIDLENKVLDFDELKTYNVEQTNPILIIKKDSKYGVISLSDGQVKAIIPYKYDFIAIPNRATDGILDTSKFIVKDESGWYVFGDGEALNSAPFINTIVDFNSKYIVTRNSNGNYAIYDYDQNVFLETMPKEKIYCLGEYVIFLVTNEAGKKELLIYNDVLQGSSNNLVLPEYEKLNFKYVKENIEVYLDEKLYQSLVLK